MTCKERRKYNYPVPWLLLSEKILFLLQTILIFFLLIESPSSSSDVSAAKRARGVGVKRGPGRPRMKPYGPAQQGTRGPRGPRGSRGSRARKAPAPLQVPVARASASAVPKPYGFYNPSD